MQLAFDERVVGLLTELKNVAELLYTGQIQILPSDICMLLLLQGLRNMWIKVKCVGTKRKPQLLGLQVLWILHNFFKKCKM